MSVIVGFLRQKHYTLHLSLGKLRDLFDVGLVFYFIGAGLWLIYRLFLVYESPHHAHGIR